MSVSVTRNPETLVGWGNFTGPADLVAAMSDIQAHGYTGELIVYVDSGAPVWRLTFTSADGSQIQYAYLPTDANKQATMPTWIVWDGYTATALTDAQFTARFQAP